MDDIKVVIQKFCEQCGEIKFISDQYYALYETSEHRLRLLEEIAPHFFFNVIQKVLIEYMFLNICKLTDPPQSCGDDNLTVKYILQRINSVNPGISQQLGLDDISKEIDKFAKCIRPARHKIIAHLDVETILSLKTLGEFEEGEDKIFWSNLQEFVNRIYEHYIGGVFPLVAFSDSGANELVEALKKAINYDDCLEDKPPGLKSDERKRMRYKDA